MNLVGSTYLKYYCLGFVSQRLTITILWGRGNQFWQPYRLSSYIYLGPALLRHDHNKAAMVVLLTDM